MRTKTLTLVTNYDDWEGIYIDGKILDQGHDINWKEVLSNLGFELKIQEADYDWLAEQGALPDKLENCKISSQC
jgi:hypothetical protein